MGVVKSNEPRESVIFVGAAPVKQRERFPRRLRSAAVAPDRSVMLRLGASRPRSGGAQHMHAFDVPGHRHEAPFALGLGQPTHAHLTPAHHLLDDAKHRLHGLLA